MAKMLPMMFLLPMARAKSWSWSSGPSPAAPGPPSPAAGPAGAPAPSTGACSAGWKCDKNWAPDGHAGFPDALEFTMWANVYRCMHDAPFIHHDKAMSTATKNWFDSRTASDGHSPTSERPDQGENMWYAMPANTAVPAKANDWWYDEIKHCSLPGCKAGKWSASHFTCMVWQSATKLGCWKNAGGLNVCRYAGGCGNCKSPNYAYAGANCYQKNVKAAIRSKAKCMTMVKQCFGDEFPHTARLYADELVEGMGRVVGSWPVFASAAAFLASVGLGAFAMRKRAKATRDNFKEMADELDQEELVPES